MPPHRQALFRCALYNKISVNNDVVLEANGIMTTYFLHQFILKNKHETV